MLQTDSETMPVRICGVRTFIVVDKVVVIKIGNLFAFLLDVSLVVVLEVVATKVHLAVEQACVSVQTAHP